MQSMTISQLRAASASGNIKCVTVRGQGGAFVVQIATRSGATALLTKVRIREPRRFGNSTAALRALRNAGITIEQLVASEWNPAEKEEAAGNRGRAEATREARQGAACVGRLAADIQGAINDPRPNLPHDEVMAEMDADIAALMARRRPATRRRV